MGEGGRAVVGETRTDGGRRDYPEAKLQNNIDSEIMQVVLEEAREAYDARVVVELPSNTPDDVDSNTERIAAWVASWLADHPDGV